MSDKTECPFEVGEWVTNGKVCGVVHYDETLPGLMVRSEYDWNPDDWSRWVAFEPASVAEHPFELAALEAERDEAEARALGLRLVRREVVMVIDEIFDNHDRSCCPVCGGETEDYGDNQPGQWAHDHDCPEHWWEELVAFGDSDACPHSVWLFACEWLTRAADEEPGDISSIISDRLKYMRLLSQRLAGRIHGPKFAPGDVVEVWHPTGTVHLTLVKKLHGVWRTDLEGYGQLPESSIIRVVRYGEGE